MRFGYRVRSVYVALKDMARNGSTVPNYFKGGYKTRVDLFTGGFVEFEEHFDNHDQTSYIRIHLGKPMRVRYLDETYKYVHYGTYKENHRLLRELREALTKLIDD